MIDNIAKIQLSKDEIELVGNTEWILTKHRIIKKVYTMFGEISQIIKEEILNSDSLFLESIKYHGGKISKGDNYQLLPYVMLDYPSFFKKENIFAVRSMFWWGNFFSITLHLSGQPKTMFITHDPALMNYLREKDFYICTNNDQWHHHFKEDNYTPVSQMSWIQFEKTIEKDFFKVAKKMSLSEWDNAFSFFKKSITEIIGILQISSPACRKDL